MRTGDGYFSHMVMERELMPRQGSWQEIEPPQKSNHGWTRINTDGAKPEIAAKKLTDGGALTRIARILTNFP
jgi:hypothetical protein